MRNGSYKRGEELFAPLPLYLQKSPCLSLWERCQKSLIFDGEGKIRKCL